MSSSTAPSAHDASMEGSETLIEFEEPLQHEDFPYPGTYILWCPHGSELSFLDSFADPKKRLSVPCTYKSAYNGSELALIPTRHCLVPETEFRCPAKIMHLDDSGRGLYWAGWADSGMFFNDPFPEAPEILSAYKGASKVQKTLLSLASTHAGVTGRFSIRLMPGIGDPTSYDAHLTRATDIETHGAGGLTHGTYPADYMVSGEEIPLEGVPVNGNVSIKDDRWPTQLRATNEFKEDLNIPTVLSDDGVSALSIPLQINSRCHTCNGAWRTGSAAVADSQATSEGNYRRKMTHPAGRCFETRVGFLVPPHVRALVQRYSSATLHE